MKVYLINYVTVRDWECTIADGMEDVTLEDLARPVGIVITSLDALPAAQAFALKDMTNADFSDDLNLRPTFEWSHVAVEDNEIANMDYWRYDLNADEKLYGVMIVRAVREIE